MLPRRWDLPCHSCTESVWGCVCLGLCGCVWAGLCGCVCGGGLCACTHASGTSAPSHTRSPRHSPCSSLHVQARSLPQCHVKGEGFESSLKARWVCGRGGRWKRWVQGLMGIYPMARYAAAFGKHRRGIWVLSELSLPDSSVSLCQCRLHCGTSRVFLDSVTLRAHGRWPCWSPVLRKADTLSISLPLYSHLLGFTGQDGCPFHHECMLQDKFLSCDIISFAWRKLGQLHPAERINV